MPDILIVSKRGRAHFIANSDLGSRWIRGHMAFEGSGANVYFVVADEHQEDIIKELQKDDIIYEERTRI